MVTLIGTDVQYAAGLLREGSVVAIPTETVYGLAGNALDTEAVVRIYEAKQRPRFNPLIMHLPSLEAAAPYVQDIPGILIRLAREFSPGPLSYLLPRSSRVPDIITAGSDKVVVRIPAHPLTLELLGLLDFPLAAPSANPSGYVSPVTAAHVYEGLHGRIPYILDGGPCAVGLESTIVGMEADELVIYRLGSVSAGDIVRFTGIRPRYSLLHERPGTPGQMKSHYATSKPLHVGDPDRFMADHPGSRVGVISFRTHHPRASHCMVLSPRGDLHEAATNLFQAMRELDRSDVDHIVAERFPDEGIGMAINDRLGRASADRSG